MASASVLSHEAAKGRASWLQGWGLPPVVTAPFMLFVMFIIALLYDPGALVSILAALMMISPLWLPVILGRVFIIWWVTYVRYAFWFQQENTLLEIQLPPEVEKSPLALDLFLSTLWNSGGEATFINRLLNGRFRMVWSLEIASNEGRVSFYIHTRKSQKDIIEARLYGQFPEAKIMEVDDYVSKVPFNLKEYSLWGCEFKKSTPDALPIKTYIDYKLDKDTKEEYKIDPISNVVEFLGQIGKGEYLWMQIVLKARKKDEWYGFYKATDDFKGPATEDIKKTMEAAAQRFGVADVASPQKMMMSLMTEGERRRVDAIERSLSKLIFECGIRVLYLGKKENFKVSNIGGVITIFNSFRSLEQTREYNALGPTRGLIGYDYPWQDFHGILQDGQRRRLFFRYKHRAFFYVPYSQTPVFLNTEELATLWHFPGSIVKTPGLTRVPSRRAEAPLNLPTMQ